MNRLLLLVFLTLIAACTAETIVCPDGTVVSDASQCPIVEQAQQFEEEVKTAAEELAALEEPEQPEPLREEKSLAPEIEALVSKVSKVKSYQFGYAPVEMNSGEMTAVEQHIYRIKGDKIKVELLEPMTVAQKTFFNYVFLDGDEARGFCIKEKLNVCEEDIVERTGDFSAYKIKLPEEWLDHIPGSATMKKGPSKWKRQTNVVEYLKEGQYYQLFLDSFFGMVMQVSIYEDAAMENLVGGAEYRDMLFNQVTEDEVLPPA
jgi:hypothetical protein